MVNMSNLDECLINYYNKFNEDKRLKSRHGLIEYINTMRYIKRFLSELEDCRIKAIKDTAKGESDIADLSNISNIRTGISILDIGAGTGAYCGALSNEGYDCYAIEMVNHNLGRLKANYPLVKARQGNAINLKKYKDSSFDMTLLFGPMYHLFSKDDKLKALSEAARVTKPGGIILVAYVMNEYSVISYGFREHHCLEAISEGKLDSDFHVRNKEQDLYDYVRLEDIDSYNIEAGLTRKMIFSPDGFANYMRDDLKNMTEEEFNLFVDYQYKISDRADLLGASAHLVDVIVR